LQYLVTTLCGIAAGTLFSIPASGLICRMTVTTTGLLIPSALPVGICLTVLAWMLLLLMGFVWFCTGKIRRISPVRAIRGTWKKSQKNKRTAFPIQKKGLTCWLALRQLLSGKRWYMGACLVAVLLVFFASLTGRVDAWLGPNGEGLMNAFNPSDLHIAAQPMGETTAREIEQTIESYTSITDYYDLAMPSVSVNGADMTANVITEPERFHLLSGQTCREADEVVLTEFVAEDLGVAVGETVTVSGTLGSGEYVVSGIYQCANDMGMNIGMNREGYDLIGEESPGMWCNHYFLDDVSIQQEIMQALQDTYGGDVYLHENSWPGLAGILSAMDLLMIFLYAMVILFVLAATLLTAGKLLRIEKKDLSIYRAMGFSVGMLRSSFALRFGVTALTGSILGTIFSAFLTDPLVAVLMRMEGISNFSSQPDIFAIVLPGAAVTILFLLFAYLAAGKIGKTPLASLAEEAG
jgi:putative ABC transport system permease protein